MAAGTAGALFSTFRAAAEDVARSRPDVDVEVAREVLHEAATLLHDGLVLDDLDEHDAGAVIAGLAADLVSADPGASVRARAGAARERPGDLHDPGCVSATYLLAAATLQL